MTEEEWLACGNALPMLSWLDPPSERRLRLFGVACCRRVWQLLNDSRSRHAVEVAERLADGLATEEEVGEADNGVTLAMDDDSGLQSNIHKAALSVLDPHEQMASINAAAIASSLGESGSVHYPELRWQAFICRDIFGNPFRPVTLDRFWLTSTVTSLAATIYEERRLSAGLFDNARLAILADALEEAGCDNADILNHLRRGGDHVRGCWVIDLILGKT